MRPTTAKHDNVFDLEALLHPGTMFKHPRDVVSHPDLDLAEKRAPGVLGVRCLGHRVMSRDARPDRPEGSRHHR